MRIIIICALVACGLTATVSRREETHMPTGGEDGKHTTKFYVLGNLVNFQTKNVGVRLGSNDRV